MFRCAKIDAKEAMMAVHRDTEMSITNIANTVSVCVHGRISPYPVVIDTDAAQYSARAYFADSDASPLTVSSCISHPAPR